MKTPEMERCLDELAQSLFSRKRDFTCCVICGNDKVKPEDFSNSISYKEFTISCMCQKCQDKIFG